MDTRRGPHEIGQALSDATGLSQEELGAAVAAGAVLAAVVAGLRLLDVLRSVFPGTGRH